MKVAILHPSFGTVGGAEVVAVNHARCLKERGFDVRIVTGHIDAVRWGGQLEGIRVDRLAAANWLDRLRGRDYWIARPSTQLEQLLRDVDVAIAENYPISLALALSQTSAKKLWYCHEPNRKIHLFDANPTIADRLAAGTVTATDAEKFFVARVKSQRGLFPGVPSRFVAAGRRDAACVSAFERIFVNSHFGAELASRAFGVRDYSVLYPLMRLAERRADRFGLDRNELRILVQTRLEPPKNVDTIIHGFAKFVEHGRHRASLHVVGEGSSRTRLERLASELMVGKNVKFYGFLSPSALNKIYEKCEVFALLPTDEPFGMVFPEAIVQGLLVVGPNHGGPFEILEEGRIGFACDAFSSDAFAAALERIQSLADAEINRLRSDAERSCRSRFAWEVLAPQLVAGLNLE